MRNPTITTELVDLLTGWHTGDQKPLRIGTYQRDYEGRIWYSYWNGFYWGALVMHAFDAEKFTLRKSYRQDLPWRGLKMNPEE